MIAKRTLPLFSSAVSTLMLACSFANGAVIADLRANYDATTHVNGVAASIADTQGSGRWTFFGRSGATVGAASSELLYTTTANGVRNANAYVLAGQTLDLPGISNTQLISGPEGAPASNQLALHPGQQGSTFPFLSIRWTPGAAEFGEATISGAFQDIGAVDNGVTIQIMDQAGNIFLNSASAGASVPFSFTTTLAGGSYIDFIIGNNGIWDGDHSAINISIDGVPEPSVVVLGGLSLLGLVARRRR